MASNLAPALVGAAAGIATSLVARFFDRRKASAETQKLLAETEKIRLEAEEIRSRLEAAQQDLRSRVANAEAQIEFDRAAPASLVVYDSTSEGFSLHDLELVLTRDALGELRLTTDRSPDDTLVLLRLNSQGVVYVYLDRLSYRGFPNAIPVGAAAGIKRTIRVQCELRALGAEHTFHLVLKEVGTPPGEHLDERTVHLATEAWTTLDEAFSVRPTRDVRLRLVDRRVSAHPSRLEIRRLIVTEREAPRSVRPDDSSSPR